MKLKNLIKFRKDPYIIAEIGINHNGDLSIVKELIKRSKDSGRKKSCVRYS